MRTQWRVGVSGLFGLDYNVLFHKMERMKLSHSEYEQLEADVRAMEYAALEEINRSRD